MSLSFRADWLRAAGSRHAGEAIGFFATRLTNAVLVLAQVALVAELYGSSDAANFFVFWTVVWCLACFIPFGLIRLLPRFVAVAHVSGRLDPLTQTRHLLVHTIPAAVLLTPLILVVVMPAGVDALAVGAPACIMGAVGWGGVQLLSSLLRGYGRVALSGLLQGFVAPVLFVLAIPIARLISDGWETLALASGCALIAASISGIGLSVWILGRGPVSAVLLAPARQRTDSEVLPAGVLTGVGEVVGWLPLWAASALSADPADLEGLYAALRISALFSWAFVSLVAVVSPLLARALEERDYERLDRLLIQTSSISFAVTLPLAVVGIVASSPLLSALDPAYGVYATTLIILILARLIDAATGPLPEALVLGRRAWWEVGNQALGLVVLLAVGIGLEPLIGVAAFAWGFAAAFMIECGARVFEVGHLRRTVWSRDAGHAQVSSARSL